jgi:hypothetical protein
MVGRLSTDRDRLRHLPEGPLQFGKLALWWLRKTFFSRPKPPNPAVFVERTEEELVGILGPEHFEPGWEFSYSYRNEALNLRRVEYVADHPLGFEWWQVHLRGYEHDDGRFELAAHFEVEPTEHPRAHVDGVGLDVDRGNEALMAVLDDAGVDYEYLDSDGTPVDRPGTDAASTGDAAG